MSDYKVTKSLNKFMTWTGRYMFLFFVAALILTAITVSNADPHVSEYRGSGEVQTYSFFLVESTQIQFFVAFDTNLRNSTFVVLQIEEGENGTIELAEYVAVSVQDVYSHNLELPAGDYFIEVNSGEGVTYWMGYAKLNIGLILTTVVLYVVFSLLAAIFFTVLPFWLIIAIIEMIGSTGSSTKDSGPLQQAKVDQPGQPAPISHTVDVSTQSTTRSTRPEFAKNTPLEKLTRKDWGWLIFGCLLFIGYIGNPFGGGPQFFFALLIFGGVFYNYTEREKTKDRMGLLLKAYPKATIAFVSEQLDKKEDHIIEVLRIMILDEGAPIRLDLVNRTITKVGPLGEPASAQPTTSQGSGPIIQPTVESDSGPISEPVSEPVSEPASEPVQAETVVEAPVSHDDTEVVEGAQGSVRQPWAYCQACGEGLKKKVKYCYVCGARQY